MQSLCVFFSSFDVEMSERRLRNASGALCRYVPRIDAIDGSSRQADSGVVHATPAQKHWHYLVLSVHVYYEYYPFRANFAQAALECPTGGLVLLWCSWPCSLWPLPIEPEPKARESHIKTSPFNSWVVFRTAYHVFSIREKIWLKCHMERQPHTSLRQSFYNTIKRSLHWFVQAFQTMKPGTSAVSFYC